MNINFTKETIACCQLGRVLGFNPVAGHHLLEYTGNAYDVFTMKTAELRSLLGTEPPSGLDMAGLDYSARELEGLAEKGSYFLGVTDEAFPPLLLECGDAPMGLYIRSDSAPEEIFRKRPYIAVVGTRDISHYGMEWCQKLTSAMCSCTNIPAIVSGLALGTDIIAHKTALEYGSPTIAVMATGIDLVYPRMHTFDADRIAASPGSALVTDYPPGTVPAAQNFLRRNRIIAGLSDATILIESRVKGGGMSTAALAFSYSRDIYALPGKIDDVRSGGCNKLIADNKAGLILTPRDLLDKLGLCSKRSFKGIRDMPLPIPEGLFPPEDSEMAENVLKLIRRKRGISKEEICATLEAGIGQVSGILSLLESEGLIFVDLLGNCSAKNNFQ
ncbi:MAG: DNA-protecting protein DprA [Bacteroidales bacterium]|nr:DNA-protecting protein DprA [Bacteroidales bacterium]